MKIFAVVPTIRDMTSFKKAWADQFSAYDVVLVEVRDGDNPKVICKGREFSVKDIMGEYEDLIYNKNDGVRNLGFAFAYQCGADVIISLDDDVEPMGDTIGHHLSALSQNCPISWFSSASEYMRGFPYNVRQEAEVWVSHGVWKGVPDMDGMTQLREGIHDVEFPRCPVPKGVLMPFCAMNFAFKREATPYVYQAPMGHKIGLDRFADIWGGVELKKDLDRLGKAMVTGYAYIHHDRASDVYKNIQKEAKGIELNDKYGEDEYFKLFFEKRNRWIKFINEIHYR